MMMMMMMIIIIINNNNIQPTLSLPPTVTQNPAGALERSSLYAVCSQALSLSQSNLHPLVDAEWLRAWRNRRLRIAGGQWEMWVAVQCEVGKVGKNDGFNMF